MSFFAGVGRKQIMARHLFIIRHAKSDWSFDVRDFDRPLSGRGFRNAPEMAAKLAGYPVKPDLLVSSPAKRALTTAQIFAEHFRIPVRDIQTDSRIYDALPLTLLGVINGWSDANDRVALFGHNPGLTLLVNYLTDAGLAELPTCAVVHIRFDGTPDWASVSRGTGELAWYAEPAK